MKRQNVPQSFTDVLFCAVLAVFFIILQTLLCTFDKVYPIPAAVFFSAIYVAVVCAFTLIRKNSFSKKNSAALTETPGVLPSAILNMPCPCVICPEEEDTVIWYNKYAAELFGRKKVPFSELFSTLPDFNGELRLGSADRRYMPMIYNSASSEGRKYRVFVMTDVTDDDERMMTLMGRECAVAYITIDNLEELLNYEQEDYRSASGETEAVLRRFAAENGGILKEYQQDRFIFFFEKSKLADFKKDGFSILDKVRNVRVGDTNIPVTVSIGVSDGGNTLTEREREAASALETALQRGGDQAVIKTDGGVDIFGGKTKMPQKRTTVRARVIATELISLISNASNVLIMGHRYADFDAFGSSVGLARLCMFCGVPVNIVSDLDDTDLDRCRSWIGVKSEYRSMFIDSDSALDSVEPDTLLIITDVNNKAQYESAALADHCPHYVVIDHHRKTADFDRKPLISYIEPSASAASELVAEMLEQVLPEDELLPREADLLMAGILLDTNQFTKNTGTRTFSAALYLRAHGADVGEVQEFFKTELFDFQRELKFHSNVEIYRDITAIASTTEPCTVKDKVPAAKAADKLLGVKGVKASFAVVPIGDEVHISARSTGTINVQLLLERLRGGGHFDSAGTRLEGIGVAETVAMLKDAIDSYLDEAAVNEK